MDKSNKSVPNVSKKACPLSLNLKDGPIFCLEADCALWLAGACAITRLAASLPSQLEQSEKITEDI